MLADQHRAASFVGRYAIGYTLFTGSAQRLLSVRRNPVVAV
jgi:hypothetical protein